LDGGSQPESELDALIRLDAGAARADHAGPELASRGEAMSRCELEELNLAPTE
jgi:hypothetical protein